MRKTTKTGRYAKIAASAVVVLLLGVLTSTALADDSPFPALTGDNGFSALASLTGSTETSTSTTSAVPTVSSDKGDYAPGEFVTLRGTNWHPGEAVHIHVNDDQGATWERDSDVVADENGEIVDSFNLPNWFVASYSVAALGATSGPATASFTDANPQSVQLAPGSLTVAPGSSAVYTVSVPMSGNDGSCTVDLSVSGLPAGATGTFGNTSLTGTKGESPSTSLTVATTGATLPGTTTFTVTAARQSNCQGNGNLVGTANLVVAVACTAASVATQPSNQSITYGANATFTAAGSGNPTPSVQWQASTNGGSNWTDISGATATSLTITKPGLSQSGNQYRAVFTNTCGGTKTATSNAATLNVAAKAITVTPTSGQTKVYGASDPTLTYTPTPSLEPGESFTGALGRAVGENAGSYAITLGSLSAGPNYSLSLTATPVNFTIKAKQVTITPGGGQSKVYGASDPALTFTNDGGLTASAFTGALSRSVGENAGSYAISLGNLSAGSNYAISLSTPLVTFAITKKAASVTAEAKTRVYGSADPALTTTDNGFLANDLGAGKITFSASRAGGESVAGSPYTITPSASDAATNLLDDYDVTYNTGTLTITKKAITVKADDKTKVYGSADPALTVTVPVGALESGDSLSGNLEREPGQNVGGHAITQGSLTAGGNYDLTVTPGTLTITKKAITVSADDKTKVYGSADPALTVTVPVGALESGDSLSGNLEREPGQNVGGHAITQGSLTAGGNYDLTVTPGVFKITKKTASVSAADKSKVYGSDDPQLTTTDSSFLAADLGAGKITFSASRAAGESVAGGPYTITPSASDGTSGLLGNYTVTINTGQLTITKKAASVTAVDKSKVYGSDDPQLTTTDSSFLAADLGAGKITFSASRAAGESVAGGPYTITPSASDGTSGLLGNYTVTINTGQLTITKKAASVTAVDKSKVYGSDDPQLTTTDSGFLAADLGAGKITFSASRAAGESVAGGPYTITPSASDGTSGLLGNYTVTINTGQLTITKKAASVTAVDKSKVYGSDDPQLTTTDSGFLAADLGAGKITFSASRAAGESVAGGPYTITPSADDGTSGLLGNYDVTINTGQLTITKKAASLTAADKSKVYGSDDPQLTTTDSGFLAADLGAGKITFSASRADGESVAGGPYTITPAASDGASGLLGNYTVSYHTASFTITKKTATVSAVANTKVYGSNDPELATTNSGFEAADLGAGKITFAASRAAGESVNGSPYLITPSAADGATTLLTNYDVTYHTASFTITKKTASVSAVANTKVYGSNDPELATTNSGFEAADLGAGKITFAASRAAGESVNGSPYLITPSAADGATTLLTNYDVTYQTASFTITRKPITVAAVDKTKVYGSNDPALTYSVPAGTLETGDSITGELTRAAGESVAGSPYAITKGSLTAGNNYDLTVTPGTLKITKKPITGNFTTPASRVYDGTTTAAVTSRSLNDTVTGDIVNLEGGTAAFDTKNVGTGKVVTLTDATLSGGDASNYSLISVRVEHAAITVKPITVKADDKTKVYGSADPALTETVPAGALESGDNLAGELVRATGKDVGDYAITKGTRTAGPNYDLTVTPGTLTITKKPITVKADDKTKVYGSADPALTETVPAGALESGDSLSGSLTRAPGSNVGDFAITQGTRTAGPNYDLTVTLGTLKITAKPITVTADAKSKIVGAADPALTYALTTGGPLVAGDSFTGSLTRVAGETVGTYAILKGTLTADSNYALTYVPANLNIYYGWAGFLQPINDTAHQTGTQESKFKLGQTIPAKFVLKNAAGAVVQQATPPTFTKSANLGSCDATAALDDPGLVTPDAGVAFNWDGSQYHYNWSTKGLTAGEYRIYANLADGTKPYVDICLTK